MRGAKYNWRLAKRIRSPIGGQPGAASPAHQGPPKGRISAENVRKSALLLVVSVVGQSARVPVSLRHLAQTGRLVTSWNPSHFSDYARTRIESGARSKHPVRVALSGAGGARWCRVCGAYEARATRST